MRINQLYFLPIFALGLLVACSDDGGVTLPDQGVKQDQSASKDQKVNQDQKAGPDQNVSQDQKVNQDQTAGPDQKIGKDLPPGDGAPPDKSKTDGSTAIPANGKCSNPQALTFSGGKATASGDTSLSKDEFPTVDCSNTYGPWPAPQLYYKANLTSGKAYKVSVVPGSTSLDLAAYAFPSATACTATAVDTACVGYSSDSPSSGATESFVIAPTTSAPWTIAVDGYSSTSTSAKGKFTLIVEEVSVPVNSACAKATALTFASGVAKASGDTSLATNEYASNVKCGNSSAFLGNQLYYKATLQGNQPYKIALSPKFYGQLYVFRASSCGTAAGINTDCGSKGVTGDTTSSSISSGTTGALYFTPATTGDFIIAVDSTSTSSTYYGTFDLEVSKFSAGTNGKCSAAQAVTFTSGKASIKGDTSGLADEYSTVKCGSNTMAGQQAYYKFDTKAGFMYTLKATTTNAAYLYIFPASACGSAANISTACSSSGATGTYSYISYISGGTVVFNPGKAGTYIVAMDYTTAGKGPGAFTIDFEEKAVASNGFCTAATPLVLTGGTVQVKGDTTGVADEYGNIKCSGSTTFAGSQVYYSFAAKANTTYRLDLLPTFYSYLYVFPQSLCGKPAQINTACGTTSTTGNYKYISSSGGGSLYFKPSAAGNYVIAVDASSTSSSYYGTFTLDVTELKPATNTTCANAEALTFTGGKATASGDTGVSTDQYAAVKCGSTTMAGPQLYYSFSATANQGYLIKLSSMFSSYLYVFKKGSCGTAASISTDCSSTGTTGDVTSISSGSSGALAFTSKTAGTFIIAVDSSSTSTSGSFKLSVENFSKPSNDSCATAKVVTLVSGKATVTDYKVGATSQLASCGSQSLPATDLWYKFTPVVGKSYKVTFKPDGGGGRFGVWDGANSCVASTVQTACGVLGSSYVSGGSSGYLTITSKSGDIYFVADGISTPMYDVYGYTFEIEQQ